MDIVLKQFRFRQLYQPLYESLMSLWFDLLARQNKQPVSVGTRCLKITKIIQLDQEMFKTNNSLSNNQSFPHPSWEVNYSKSIFNM